MFVTFDDSDTDYRHVNVLAENNAETLEQGALVRIRERTGQEWIGQVTTNVTVVPQVKMWRVKLLGAYVDGALRLWRRRPRSGANVQVL